MKVMESHGKFMKIVSYSRVGTLERFLAVSRCDSKTSVFTFITIEFETIGTHSVPLLIDAPWKDVNE